MNQEYVNFVLSTPNIVNYNVLKKMRGDVENSIRITAKV